MIRKFIHVTVFTATITLASFGQHIFGREDIIALAHTIQKEGPHRAQIAWAQTDAALAQLAPEAGSPTPQLCTFDNLQWSAKVFG